MIRNPFGLTNRARVAIRDMYRFDPNLPYDPGANLPPLNGQTIHLPASAVAAQLPDDIPEPDPMAAFDRLRRLKFDGPDCGVCKDTGETMYRGSMSPCPACEP